MKRGYVPKIKETFELKELEKCSEENKRRRTKMAKKLIIDEDLCEGCETCVSLCPDVFELGENGKARIKNPDALESCNIQEAIDSCPVGAIRWEE
jgi:ferredoxin